MLSAAWSFFIAMLRLGWLTLIWRSTPSDIPYASERTAKALAWLTYLATYELSYLASGSHLLSGVMALGAWLTLIPVRRRYGPRMCASFTSLLIVFMLCFSASMILLPAGSPFTVYVYGGLSAVYYIAAVRLLRQTPQDKPCKAHESEVR